MAGCKLICRKNYTQVNKDNIHKNNGILYYDYKVGDTLIINNRSAYKYKTLYNRPFEINQCWTYGVVTF